MRKLIDFEITEKENILHFIICGDFDVKQIEGTDYLAPVFHDISIKKVENGVQEDWEPSSVDWIGTKMTSYHAMSQTYDDLIRKASKINVAYLDDEIQKLVAQYEKETVDVNGRKVPKVIHINRVGNGELIYCTNLFAYYYNKSKDDLIMVRLSDMETVAGYEFAEIGIRDSIDNVGTNEELLVFSDEEAVKTCLRIREYTEASFPVSEFDDVEDPIFM